MYSLLNAQVVRANSFESKNGEDDDTGVNGCGCVANRQDESIFDAIVSRRIVTAERDQRTKSNVERIEDLGCRVQPNGRVQ